ncbi:ABC transporter ATP-binding protein [Pseudonocardia sp. RS010]|uniref:ABC transporter ATP-binding protein n=1 Tax=Pseudonocardia sp. RS010 TaxID=3385979 RepID=UPI0039A06CBC
MRSLEVSGLTKTFTGRSAIRALDDVQFEVAAGEMLVLLGPSGCGKTTTLRCIAGLEDPDDGRVVIGGQTVLDTERRLRVPTHRRSIGLVFQSFALWPHMSARKNIEFPLRSRRVGAADRESSVRAVAKLVQLTDEHLGKRPGQLSGGQQQRVALARALVGRSELILFDEPLSNLDAQLREQLRSDLHQMHTRLGFTGVYVTHDLTEALTLGTTIAVMRAGRVAQLGTPAEVFEHPADPQTAELLGYRRLARLAPEAGSVRAEEGEVTGDVLATVREPVDLYVSPGFLTVLPDLAQPVPGVALRGARVTDISYQGAERHVVVEHRTGTLRVPESTERPSAASGPGQEVTLAVKPEHVHLFPLDRQVTSDDPPVGELSEPATV